MVGVSDNVRGFLLAISSSIFIGSSFIIKKMGLKKSGANGTRASDGGYGYLKEPWWWAGMIAMILGEAANFAAYAFAPAILVTPLGALSIIFSAVLAHFILDESLHIFGVVGCVLCLVGSVTIVLHAPLERDIESVKQVWHYATEPGFIIYFFAVLGLVVALVVKCVPRYGQRYMVIYIGICSLMGSLTVMAVKAVAIALKLSLSGSNQFVYFQTWFFTIMVISFCVMQIIYLNKALDTFNTAVVSPVYYVMFTTFTILASMIMFKGESQTAQEIITELCGFITILSGTFLLHKTRDMGVGGCDGGHGEDGNGNGNGNGGGGGGVGGDGNCSGGGGDGDGSGGGGAVGGGSGSASGGNSPTAQSSVFVRSRSSSTMQSEIQVLPLPNGSATV